MSNKEPPKINSISKKYAIYDSGSRKKTLIVDAT